MNDYGVSYLLSLVVLIVLSGVGRCLGLAQRFVSAFCRSYFYEESQCRDFRIRVVLLFPTALFGCVMRPANKRVRLHENMFSDVNLLDMVRGCRGQSLIRRLDVCRLFGGQVGRVRKKGGAISFIL